MTNYYQILAIDSGADGATVKAAVMRQLRTWSGRASSPSLERRQEAEKTMKLISEAEAVLCDPARRKEYDRDLAAQPKAAAGPSPAAEAAPNSSAERLVEQGLNMSTEGRYADALELATRATELQGNYGEAWALLARVHDHIGEKQQALFEYARALRLMPADAGLQFETGLVHEGLKDYDRALEHFEAAKRLSPNDVAYRAEIAWIYYLKDNRTQAISIWEDCLRTDPANKPVKDMLAQVLLERESEALWTIPSGMGLPEGRYASSLAQIQSAQAAIDKVRQLGAPSARLNEIVQELESFIAASLTMHFQGTRRILIGAAAMSALGWVWIGGFSGFLYQLWYLGGGALYFFASRIPAYAVVASRLQQQGGKTSIGLRVAENGPGCLLSLAFLFLPFVAIVTYIKNRKFVQS